MKLTTKLFSALALLALLLAPASPAFAKGLGDGGPVIFGGNYTLESGKTLDGDLVVFGGNVEIQVDAQVKGSIVVFGGNVTMDGIMDGDLVIFGGAGSLGSKSVVGGDLVTVGGTISRADGSVVKGQVRNQPTIEIPSPTVPSAPNPSVSPSVNINPIGSAVSTLFFAMVMAALAMLLVLFLHPQMDRVAQAVIRQPIMTGAFGLLTAVLFPFAVLLMVVTLILIPVAILATIVFVAAWVFGVVALGMETGERFTRAIGQVWPPVLTTGFGTFLLVLVVGGLGIIPCVGWVPEFLIALAGIGAVTLTIFGSRSYPLATVAPAAGGVPNESKGPAEPLPPAS